MNSSNRFESRTHCRILVTGAAGFIGSHTVDALLASGHQVMGLDDLSAGSMQNLGSAKESDEFEFIQADVLDSDTLDQVCRQFAPHAVIHLAGLVSGELAMEKPRRNFHLNIEATQLVLETARKNGVSRVVYASSADVYGDCNEALIHENCPTRPIGLMGASRLASENLMQGYAMSYGMETISLRYFNVYGERQTASSPGAGVISNFAERFARGEAVNIYGNGEQTRDFVSVRDVARANVLAATNRNVESGARNICTGFSRSVNDLVKIFQTFYPDSPMPVKQPERPADILRSCGNTGYSGMTLGFEAYISLEDGLADLVSVKNLSPFDTMALPG